MSGREVGLWLVATRRRHLPPEQRRRLPAAATFMVVAVDRSSGTPVPTVLASDLDVPRDVKPVEFAKRCADARGDRWTGYEADLLTRWDSDRQQWVAWDSKARTEERALPLGARYPVAGERSDFAIRVGQTAEAAA